MSRAIAYLRTSSAANVEGDSAHRQNEAVMAYAARAGLEVDSCFWDAAVSGADPIETRAGFVALLDHAEDAGIGIVIVEDASRFARSVIAQELGVLLLVRRGVRLFTSSGQELSDESDPSKVAMRQMAGVFAQYEKAKLVEKLRGARERVRATGAKCEGRKGHAEKDPEIVREARRLARRNPKTGRTRTLREIAATLVELGFVSSRGRALSHTTVRDLLGR